MIQHQVMRKQQQQKLHEKEQATATRTSDDQKRMKTEEEEDNLITYREFIQAVKNLKTLYKRILPRTLSFREVLMCQKYEQTFEVSDSHADDFAMFRYEINSIFKQYQYKDEDDEEKKNFLMGRHPLSKTD